VHTSPQICSTWHMHETPPKMSTWHMHETPPKMSTWHMHETPPKMSTWHMHETPPKMSTWHMPCIDLVDHDDRHASADTTGAHPPQVPHTSHQQPSAAQQVCHVLLLLQQTRVLVTVLRSDPHTFIHLYIYIYIYTCTHVHTYIHAHVQKANRIVDLSALRKRKSMRNKRRTRRTFAASRSGGLWHRPSCIILELVKARRHRRSRTGRC
jgi:hypothetical protein